MSAAEISDSAPHSQGRSLKLVCEDYMKRILLSLLIVASLLIALACQPSGSGGDKVRIGVFMSLTGSTANFGISSVNGIKMAADEVNATGGINGKQVELLVQDDRSDA
jgi:branched-chain amino acid transport system substrate-binding protein